MGYRSICQILSRLTYDVQIFKVSRPGNQKVEEISDFAESRGKYFS